MGSRWDIRNEGGAALIIALGVMSIMIIIGITVTALALNSNRTVAHDIRLTEAQNVAEAGVDDAIAVTLSNYNDLYPGGSYPSANHQGDGEPFFEQPQRLDDAQGNEVGTYQVWTKEDPDRPGNVLITSIGTMDGTNLQTSTVRVSVKYTAKVFDYALFVGDPEQTYDNPSGFSGDCVPELNAKAEGGNVDITGNVHVNGCIQINTSGGGMGHGGRGGGMHNNQGTVSFLSRDGYTDTVTYTDTYSGDTPDGNQPTQGDEIAFPTVDFDSFGNVVNVDISSNSVPSGVGWSRHGNNLSISAEDFQTNYGSYDAVSIRGVSNAELEIEITGSGSSNNPWVITPSILLPGRNSGSESTIKELELTGPGLSYQPTNGIAIVSAEGEVEVGHGVVVGAPGAGALIYVTGQQQESEFEVEEGAEIYGSVIVSSNEVKLEGSGGRGCGHHNNQDKQVSISYDPAFLSSMPYGWWSGGDLTAVKENFERG